MLQDHDQSIDNQSMSTILPEQSFRKLNDGLIKLKASSKANQKKTTKKTKLYLGVHQIDGSDLD